MLLLTGFGAISAYLALRKAEGRRRWVYVLIMSLLLGALVSTKWTGLAIVWLIGFAWLFEGVLRRRPWRRMLGEGAAVILTIAIIYVGSFMVHFTLLNRSGDGDAYMSERFQSTLRGNRYYDARANIPFGEKFIELNHEMYSAQSTLNGVTHPYASRWYSWPFMMRPVYYWQGQTLPDGSQGNIYLLGNPVIWVLGIVSVAVAFIALVVSSKWLRPRSWLTAFLLAGYAINFVPFVFIDRPMFLYHYLLTFVLSILLFGVVVERLLHWQANKYGRRTTKWTYLAIVLAICLSFTYFLPLSYGWPLSQGDLQQHMWLQTWR
jgi:dolichyl-phosphate-mannose--protein O-mannosyl transferase